MSTYRTHRCNELRESHVGEEVTLSGWINNHRDHGGVLFIDLRDSFGITQLVSYPESGFKYEVAHLQKENCIRVVGTVKKRDTETINPKLETGMIEVEINTYDVLGSCDPLPFQVFPEDKAPEELRLTYRYLDLRRRSMHTNILKRTKIISSARRTNGDDGVH